MTASEQLLVFDIKRFAVHDGSGIRTTVFLKGCDLRCQWCQNPEGLEKKRNILWLENKCMHCGLCMHAKKENQMTWDRDHPALNYRYQGSWENVVNVCPTGALHYDSQWYTVDSLMKEIRKDEPFFRHGGGVTFSGGEPLLAGNALIHVLEQCRKNGIHTAIETALFVPPQIVCRAAPFLDQMYCDMKIFNPQERERLTGRNPELIRENLQYLLKSDNAGKVTVRTPLIPGMTDSDQNIHDIASWITSICPDVKYEMLNYNELAPAKYPMTGKTYIPGTRKKLSEERMKQLRAVAREAGIINLL